MALLKEHFEFGLIAGGILYVILFTTASYLRLFGHFYIWLISFILGFIVMIAGSLLPDLDAPQSPVHDSTLVFFGGLVLGILQKYSPFYLALPVASIFSIWIDRNYLPAHRGFVHSIGAGIIIGLLLSVNLYIFVTKNWIVCLWSGFSLILGYFVHLLKDNWVRI